MLGMRVTAAVALALVPALTACQVGPVNYAGARGDLPGANIGGSVNIGAGTGSIKADGQKQETKVDSNYAPGFGTGPSVKP